MTLYSPQRGSITPRILILVSAQLTRIHIKPLFSNQTFLLKNPSTGFPFSYKPLNFCLPFNLLLAPQKHPNLTTTHHTPADHRASHTIHRSLYFAPRGNLPSR